MTPASAARRAVGGGRAAAVWVGYMCMCEWVGCALEGFGNPAGCLVLPSIKFLRTESGVMSVALCINAFYCMQFF